MTGFRIASTAFAAALAFGSPASAQAAPPGGPAGAAAATDALTAAQTAAIDTIAATVIERKATPSVAIGVAKNGRLVFAKAYGYRNLDDRVPADADTLYGIGSNTKQFTAAAIMMLRDQGKIDVDAPVARYLPGIPHGDEVKVRNLLTHTGGYAEYTELPDSTCSARAPRRTRRSSTASSRVRSASSRGRNGSTRTPATSSSRG
ncbi:MAG TPA: serine hydrolase domain-containing protein [Candidatus Elarobacter sp.]|nr:serine hydrolase domain-containing protein [Candidatus Elarobacter sp.]